MRFAYGVFLLLVTFYQASFADVTVTAKTDRVWIENDFVFVEIKTTKEGSHAPLRITSFIDKKIDGERSIAYIRWMSMSADFAKKFAAAEDFTCLPDVARVIDTGKNHVTLRSNRWVATDSKFSVPLQTTVKYQLLGRKLSVSIKFRATGEVVLSSKIGAYSYFRTSDFKQLEAYNWHRKRSNKAIITYKKREDLNFVTSHRPAYHFRFEGSKYSLDVWSPDGALDNSYVRTENNNTNWVLSAELFSKAMDSSFADADQVLDKGTTINKTVSFAAGKPKETLTHKIGPAAVFSPHPNAYSNVFLQIVDDIPFDPDEQWYVCKGLDDDKAQFQYYFRRLLAAVPRLKMNWVILFDSFTSLTQEDVDDPWNSPNLWVEPGAKKSQFWRIHNRSRHVAEATLEYHQYLRDLQNRKEGFYSQVELGNHSYHHQRADDISLAEWENDAAGKVPDIKRSDVEATFKKIQDECKVIGIKMPAVLRTPRFRFQEVCLPAFAKYGTRVMDFGHHDRMPHTIFTGEGTIVALYWNWSPEPKDQRKTLNDMLRKGWPVLGYGHPGYDYFGNAQTREQELQELINTFSWAETAYPDMEYYFPSEYGTFVSELESIEWIDERYIKGKNVLNISFSGACRQGETIIVQMAGEYKEYDKAVKVDGKKVKSTTLRGNKLFIVLPVLKSGVHVMRIPL